MLSSTAGGSPTPPSVLGAPRTDAGATVRVTGSGRTSYNLRVTSTTGRPFWLILGQSFNAGWQATVSGGAHLVSKQLVNGYANGFEIAPGRAGTFTVQLRWGGQGAVWIGLALIWLGRRRRADTDPSDPEPELTSPLVADGSRPSARVVAIGVLTTGVIVGVASRPWIGLVAAAAVGATLWWPRARAVLTVGSVGALAVSALYVVVQQGRYRYPTIFNWPSNFGGVADVAWLAVMLLGADAFVQILRWRARRRAPGIVPPDEAAEPG